MNNRFTKKDSSFEIGEAFEKYVETELFTDATYALVNRTNSFEQNKNRYAESTLHPDYKFRNRKTGQEFYVEAKYRSAFNEGDKLDIMSQEQYDRFMAIQQDEKTPIFIAIGYLGSPNKPKNISLIPLDGLDFLDLYDSFLRKFSIAEKPIPPATLNLKPTEAKTQASKIQTLGAKPMNPKAEKKTPKMLLLSLCLAAVVALALFFLNQSNHESKIKAQISAYYHSVDLGEVERLDDYVSPYVSKWYSHTNVTLGQIKQITYEYIKRFPRSSTTIDWNTFRVEKMGDDFVATYELDYQIKTKGKFNNKVYHQRVKTLWSDDYRIKSLTIE